MVGGFNLNSSKMGLSLGILIILVILIAFLSISKVDVSEDAFESTKKFGLVRSILLETMALGRCTSVRLGGPEDGTMFEAAVASTLHATSWGWTGMEQTGTNHPGKPRLFCQWQWSSSVCKDALG